jgi:hypothetical protein
MTPPAKFIVQCSCGHQFKHRPAAGERTASCPICRRRIPLPEPTASQAPRTKQLVTAPARSSGPSGRTLWVVASCLCGAVAVAAVVIVLALQNRPNPTHRTVASTPDGPAAIDRDRASSPSGPAERSGLTARGGGELRPDAPAGSLDPGRKFALLVGVSQYDTAELTQLKYPENDITSFAQLLEADHYKRVVLMSYTAGGKQPGLLPTAENVRETLKGFLADREPGDTVLVALAGHGVQFRGETESYFCPMNARLDNKSTLIPLSKLYEDLGACKAGFKLLVVDACRNDPEAKNSRAAGQLESVTRPQELRRPGGVAALFSCSPGERAFEDDGLKHGVFFHHLMEGWKGKAALPGDKAVTLDGLAAYLKREVPEHVKAHMGERHRQMPHPLLDRTEGVVALSEFSRPMSDASKAANPGPADLAPEKSEWAGTGLGFVSNKQTRHPVVGALTITERHGPNFKALYRFDAYKMTLEGSMDALGQLNFQIKEKIDGEFDPSEYTCRGQVTSNRISLSFQNRKGDTGHMELKRMPESVASFSLRGRWKVVHSPAAWTGILEVSDDNTFYDTTQQVRGTWSRDGGVIHVQWHPAQAGERLAIDPDNPNELRGTCPIGPGSTWIRQ